MKIIPLGISSGVPTRGRNVSGTAVILDGKWIMIDCGESTQHRLIDTPLRTHKLDAILITHMHGDHVLGLPGLLSTMSMQNREKPLALYGPEGLKRFLKNVLEDSYVYMSFPLDIHEVSEGLVRAGEDYKVSCLPLDHVIPSIGYAIEENETPGKLDVQKARALGLEPGPEYGRLKHGDTVSVGGREIKSRDVVGEPRKGRKLAYCGDTRPCENTVRLATGADLLIHEATYSSDMEAEARERGHSTAAQAAHLAKRAGVKHLLLNHFSPRYNLPDVLLDEARGIFPHTFAAEENHVYRLEAGGFVA